MACNYGQMVYTFASPKRLQVIAHELVGALEAAAASSKVAKIVGYQVSLIEGFDYETRKYGKLGYCDFELAYVSYRVAAVLLERNRAVLEAKGGDFAKTVATLLTQRAGLADSVEAHLAPDGAGRAVTEDTLLKRFEQLSLGNLAPSMAHLAAQLPESAATLLEATQYDECITAPQLHKILGHPELKLKVLLIDFRSKREFDYNHIRYVELVQIDPQWVKNLNELATDQDLEAVLERELLPSQFKRFQHRASYELVVIYNLKFGSAEWDANHDGAKFEVLRKLLISGNTGMMPQSAPFSRLTELIVFHNKYLSSRLKRHPVFLGGGVAHWFALYGEQAIAKTQTAEQPASLSRPAPSVTRNGSRSSLSSVTTLSRRHSYNGTGPMNGDLLELSRSSSPYLRNFSDYISTATSTGAAPPIRVPPSMDPPPAYSPPPTNWDQPSTKPPTSQSSPLPLSVIKPQGTPSSSLRTVKFLEQYSTGLTNLGNSCYMNCVLQCLGATPQLTGFFFPSLLKTPATPSPESVISSSYRQHINVNNKLGTKGILTTNFVSLLTSMFTNHGKFFTPSNFKKVIGSLSPGGQFASFDQQDCIEFLNFLLDGLHEDLNQMAIKDPKEKQAIMELSPEQEKTRELLPVRLASTIEWERYLKINFLIVVDYFQGQYLSQLKCLECGMTSTTYNAFLILSLPIPQRMSKLTLDDCLKEFLKTELLDEDNKWHCPHCKRFTRLTKKLSITRLPQVLIIHFKRFKINPRTGYFDKLNTEINYPVGEVLDLTPFWPDVGTATPGQDPAQAMLRAKEEQILSTLPTRNQKPPFRYRLYGVVNHFGTLSTGHYTSYVFKESDAKKTREWCYFDDAKVTYNCKDSQVRNSNAYCLFFQRI